MQFSINKSELLNALNVVSKGVSAHTTLPVLAGVKITASNASLTMETTDLQRSVRYTAAALVEEEGTTVIPQRLLLDIVKNLPDAAVTIAVGDEDATLSCESSSFTLRTLEAADFPEFPSVDVENRVSVPFAPFSSMAKRVAKIVSRDQTRAVLTGVLLVTTPQGMRMVSTDSYRLAVGDIDFEGADEGFEAIVAGSFLQEVASLPALDENIEICLSESQVVFNFQNIVLINRRIEGRFPNYKQLIPDSYVTRACFSTQDLITSVRRIGLISGSSADVRFDINADANNAQITASSKDMGSAEETVACAVEGENQLIALNHQYVLDGLSSITTDQVYFEIQSSKRPGIFRAATGEKFLYLLMPVRIA
jgi:DNA polymerase-3 subunit beta